MIGAVSPATRAIASIVPVTIPPSDAGTTTLTTVFQRRAPSAALASRSELGTSVSTSCVERAISGISMIASATPAIQAAWPWPTTSSPKMKMPITIDGTPLRTSSTSRTNRLVRTLANSLVKIATRTPIGTASAVAIATMTSVPTIALATPAPSLCPTAELAASPS